MSTIILSENANHAIKSYLREQGHSIIQIRRTNAVYDAISSHADIYLCKLKDRLILSKEQLPFLSDELNRLRISYTAGNSVLGSHYPENIKYNAVQIGNFFVHNLKHTDPVLLENAASLNLKLIHTKQGYTKCNVAVLDDSTVITSDAGISKTLKEQGINVLLISQGHVRLESFPYGFLGGASGRIGNEILFHGDLAAHPDYQKIKDLIHSRGLQLRYFPEFPLEDIGSIIEV